ncbi:MAG: ABC-type transport auxiliary lipoprotein family protein [Caulobacteraceae bacterium]
MSPFRKTAPLAAIILALSLAGCVSLLPKSKPAQLYRFGMGGADATAPPGGVQGPMSGVVLQAVSFPRAAGGDQILTITGGQAAYISESRWISPAQVLFQEAVQHSFDTRAHRARLLNRGEIGAASAFLRLEVRSFEARYDQGATAAPQVAVVVLARMSALDGQVVGEQTFHSEIRATDNRVGPITSAFDASVDKVLGDITTWADLTAPPPRPGRAPAVTTTTTTVVPAPGRPAR